MKAGDSFKNGMSTEDNYSGIMTGPEFGCVNFLAQGSEEGVPAKPMAGLQLTRDEAKELVALLEAGEPSKVAAWRFKLAGEIRFSFGLIP